MDRKENKLKTILQFSVPSVIAMLLETVITITDGYFTGNYVGEDALAAINLGLPVLYFYLGVGLCVGVGGAVICGKMCTGDWIPLRATYPSFRTRTRFIPGCGERLPMIPPQPVRARARTAASSAAFFPAFHPYHILRYLLAFLLYLHSISCSLTDPGWIP